MLRRLCFPLAIALLLPATAWASAGPGLLDAIATTVAYARYALFLAGVASVFGLAHSYSSGGKTGGWYALLFLSLVGWPAATEWLHVLGVHPPSTMGLVAGAGRSAQEYLDEKTGLLTAGKFASSRLYNLIVGAVFLGTFAFAVSGVDATTKEDPTLGEKRFVKKIVSLLLVSAVCAPFWTYRSTNDATSAIKDMLAHQAAARRAADQSVSLPGPLPSRYNLNNSPALATAKARAGQFVNGSSGDEPEVLVMLNNSLDQFVAWAVSEISDSDYETYGTAELDSMTQNLSNRIPAWLDGSLKLRVMYFIDTCAEPEAASISVNYPGASSGLSSDPTALSAKLDPLTSLSPGWFSSHHMPFCSAMLRGGYKIGTVTYQYPLSSEILASAAINDPRVREDFPGMNTIRDAVNDLPQIKSMYTDWKSNVSYMFEHAMAQYAAQPLSLSGGLASAWQDVNGVGGAGKAIASGFIGEFFQGVATAKGSGSASTTTVTLPQKMSEIDNYFLTIYPFVYLGAMVGGIRIIGLYTGFLFSTKAYVIPWAIVINHVSERAAYELNQHWAQQLAFIHSQQDMLQWSPWLVMAGIVAATGVSVHQLKGGI